MVGEKKKKKEKKKSQIDLRKAWIQNEGTTENRQALKKENCS